MSTQNKGNEMANQCRKGKAAIPTDLIAPCGMNCRLCWGYIREKNSCPGCRRDSGPETQKSKYRRTCKIRNCEHLTKGKTRYCSHRCSHFPCTGLKQLDKRYRKKYGMSMIENLKRIDALGIRAFIRDEKSKRVCSEFGEMICVHKPRCLSCGGERNLGRIL